MRPQNPKSSPAPSAPKSVPPPNFDTMGTMRTLTEAGFVHGQASAVVETVRDAQRELVTKTYFDQAFRRQQSEVKAAFQEFFGEMKVEIQKLRSEMKANGMVRSSLIRLR